MGKPFETRVQLGSDESSSPSETQIFAHMQKIADGISEDPNADANDRELHELLLFVLGLRSDAVAMKLVTEVVPTLATIAQVSNPRTLLDALKKLVAENPEPGNISTVTRREIGRMLR